MNFILNSSSFIAARCCIYRRLMQIVSPLDNSRLASYRRSMQSSLSYLAGFLLLGSELALNFACC